MLQYEYLMSVIRSTEGIAAFDSAAPAEHEVRRDRYHRRNHQTMMKNQKTMMRNRMYHNQRQPCRAAMLFIRRNVPLRMPEVSAKASFCMDGCMVQPRRSFKHL